VIEKAFLNIKGLDLMYFPNIRQDGLACDEIVHDKAKNIYTNYTISMTTRQFISPHERLPPNNCQLEKGTFGYFTSKNCCGCSQHNKISSNALVC
jgi:hypothetical protein